MTPPRTTTTRGRRPSAPAAPRRVRDRAGQLRAVHDVSLPDTAPTPAPATELVPGARQIMGTATLAWIPGSAGWAPLALVYATRHTAQDRTAYVAYRSADQVPTAWGLGPAPDDRYHWAGTRTGPLRAYAAAHLTMQHGGESPAHYAERLAHWLLALGRGPALIPRPGSRTLPACWHIDAEETIRLVPEHTPAGVTGYGGHTALTIGHLTSLDIPGGS